jgi:glycogen debranching enzyme
MTEMGVAHDPFEVRAAVPRPDGRTRVLKRGETFLLCDRFGDIADGGASALGLYHEGTRFLSRLALTLGGRRPLLLNSAVREDNGGFVAHLANDDLLSEDGVEVPRGTIYVLRENRVFSGGLTQAISIRYYGPEPIEVRLRLSLSSDFADVFEVRGTTRAQRGRVLPGLVEPSGVRLSYAGRDGLVREARVLCDPGPDRADPAELVFTTRIPPHGDSRFVQTVFCHAGAERAAAETPVRPAAAEPSRPRPSVSSGHEPFDEWLRRSDADLRMMLTEQASGPYPDAGVPWFCTPFGRDGIVTALETLWLDPTLARGVLAYLAATQASDLVPDRDAEPGKILHESRKGEMAALGEVPFGRYYGSVDATPLFVVLAAAYARRVDDLPFLESLWPHIERALDWTDRWGDRDGDGFVEYFRESPNGLVHQGWRDSRDAIFHADGEPARGPIALAEVQGYLYAARRGAAELARRLGFDRRGVELDRRAASLQERFDRAFWCDDLGAYAMALDGVKRPCRVLCSTAAHALWTGIAKPERAAAVARVLLSPRFFSGWGIRTIARSQARYNPMSYHNGSIWPHDNALAAAGLARYGLQNECARLLAAFLDLARHVERRRIPELFCGFARREGEGPTLYPMACSPQSWSAGAVFLLVQACLGLELEGGDRRVRLRQPVLPPFLDRLHLENLDLDGGSFDLIVLRRHGGGVDAAIEHADLEVDLVVELQGSRSPDPFPGTTLE